MCVKTMKKAMDMKDNKETMWEGLGVEKRREP